MHRMRAPLPRSFAQRSAAPCADDANGPLQPLAERRLVARNRAQKGQLVMWLSGKEGCGDGSCDVGLAT